VPRRQAIRHAKGRNGPWQMAKPIASGVGMTNAWLALQGVVSLKSLWAELAPLRRTAPVADPRVGWCGESRPQGPSLPDFVGIIATQRPRLWRVAIHQLQQRTPLFHLEFQLRSHQSIRCRTRAPEQRAEFRNPLPSTLHQARSEL